MSRNIIDCKMCLEGLMEWTKVCCPPTMYFFQARVEAVAQWKRAGLQVKQVKRVHLAPVDMIHTKIHFISPNCLRQEYHYRAESRPKTPAISFLTRGFIYNFMHLL